MFGSDWPVAILAGDYQKVKAETEKTLTKLSEKDKQSIWSETAKEFYGLDVD